MHVVSACVNLRSGYELGGKWGGDQGSDFGAKSGPRGQKMLEIMKIRIFFESIENHKHVISNTYIFSFSLAQYHQNLTI